jgi:hypothetical protein
MEIAPFDAEGLDRIIRECLAARPDLRTDEMLHFVCDRAAHIHNGRIRSATGFLIDTLPKCVAGDAFVEWRNRRAAAAQAEPATALPKGPKVDLPADLDPDRGRRLWASILAAAQQTIKPHSFDVWLRPTRALGVSGSTLFVRIPTPEFAHIEHKYAEVLGVQAAPLGVARLEFVAAEALAEK